MPSGEEKSMAGGEGRARLYNPAAAIVITFTDGHALLCGIKILLSWKMNPFNVCVSVYLEWGEREREREEREMCVKCSVSKV